jgi:hypothetical protein
LETLEPRRLFAAGDLDPTFGGGDGQAIVPIAAVASAHPEVMARQADGKFLIAGTQLPVGAQASATKLNLIRLESDGDLDPTFGGGMPSSWTWPPVNPEHLVDPRAGGSPCPQPAAARSTPAVTP